MNVIIKIYKEIPQSLTLDIVMFIIKLLPLFMITHDFNISFNKGISHYLRMLALCDLFSSLDKYILHIISFILLAIAIIVIVSFAFVIHNIEKYDKLTAKHEALLKTNTLIVFFVYYLLNQYIYSYCIEEIFCQGTPMTSPYGVRIDSGNECKTFLYYVMLIIICVIVLFSLIASIIVNMISYDICFKSSGINMVHLNSVDVTHILFPLFQAVIQLEYHIDFQPTIIIKNCLRALFVISYAYAYYSHEITFCSFHFVYFSNFINSMCFISCLIEWCFCFDIGNYLVILTNSTKVIIMKLAFEVILSKLLVAYYFNRENVNMKNFIMAGLKGGHIDLQSVQSFFYFIYYRHLHVRQFIFISKLALEGYKENVHSLSCSQYCFFCANFSLISYQLQLNKTLKEINKQTTIHVDKEYLIKSNELSLKETFPSFNALMEYIIKTWYEKNKAKSSITSHNKKKIEASFICAMYYYIFERNHYKSLFFIEQITKTAVYQEKFILRLQINLFQYKITSHFKEQNSEMITRKNSKAKTSITGADNQVDIINEKMQTCIIKEMHMNYQCIEKIIKGEKMLIDSVKEYLKIMELMYSDMITYNEYAKAIKIFKNQTHYNMRNIPLIFNNKSSSSLPYSPEKFWLYFEYFGNKEAKEAQTIKLYFNQTININNENDYSVLVLNSIVNKDKIRFTIEYISDSLMNILDYSSTEYKLLEFNQLLSTTFVKPYNYTLEQAIKTGQDKIYIKNFCLVDKERYAMMFHLTGVTIYSQNTLKLFAKIEEATEQMTINKSKMKKRKSKAASTLNNYCGTCFLFAKKNGRIVSICRDFETMFYLTSPIITKYNINMKELLKVEQLNSEGTIERDLATVLNNIIEINIMKVGSSGEDDFSKQIPLLKEALDIISALPDKLTLVINYEEQKLPKSSKKYSKFYLFVLSISSSNRIHRKEEDNANTVMEDSVGYYPNGLMKTEVFDRSSLTKDHTSMTKSTINKDEMQDLIYLVKILAFKHLFKKYNLMTKNSALNHQVIVFEVKIDKSNESKIDKSNYNELSDHSPSYHKQRKDNERNKAKKSKSIRGLDNKLLRMNKCYPSMPFLFKALSYAICFLVFCAILALSITRSSSFEVQRNYYHIISYLELTRSIATNFLATILYMLFQGNNLQKEAIDNNIDTSHGSLIQSLEAKLMNFNFIQSSITHFFYYNADDITNDYLLIMHNKYPVILFDITHKALLKNDTFTSLLDLGALSRSLENSKPVLVFFNQTNGSYINGKSIDFYAEAVYVKVIENYITLIRYIYLELIYSFPEVVYQPIIRSRRIISIISMSLTIALTVICIIIMKVYSYYSQFVFAHHLMVFVELRFFYFYLEKKTQLIIEYLKNNGEKRNMRNLLVLNYQNEKRKLNQLIALYNDNKDLVIKIKPFSFIQSEFSMNKKFTNEFKETTKIININELEDLKLNINNNNAKREYNNPRLKKSNAGLLSAIKNKASMKAFAQPSSKISSQLMTMDKINNSKSLINAHNTTKNDQTLERSGTGRLINTSKTGSSISSNLNLLQTSSSTTNLKSQTHNFHLECINNSSNSNNCLNDQNGKALIEKPKDEIKSFALLSLALILLLICGIIDAVYTDLNTKNVFLLLSSQFTLLTQINSAQEILLTYQLAILKNKEVHYEFPTKNSFLHCVQTNQTNPHNATSDHNIFRELEECYSPIKNEALKIMSSPTHSVLRNIRNYFNSINTEEFCRTLADYPSKHLESVQHLSILSNSTKDDEQLYSDCEKIGNGLNSKGLTNALNSLYVTLIDLYEEFISDPERDGNSNKLRLNDKKVLSFQAEIMEVFHLIPIQYLGAFSMDYDQFDIDYHFFTLVIAIVESFLTLFAMLQLFLLINRNNEENVNIEFLEKCLISTILF